MLIYRQTFLLHEPSKLIKFLATSNQTEKAFDKNLTIPKRLMIIAECSNQFTKLLVVVLGIANDWEILKTFCIVFPL